MLDEKFINLKKNENNSYLFTNVAFAFFPISFVLGSLIVNLNLVLICCLGFYHLKFKIINTKLDITFKIIFIFFLAIFFSTCLSFFKAIYFNSFESIFLIASCDSTNCAYPLEKLIKSILFFRYFLFLLIVYLLKKFGFLNFKYFFLVITLTGVIVSLDIVFQYFFGFNTIGLKSSGFVNSGFFGDEKIAATYIQRFAFFSIFFVLVTFKDKNYLQIPSTIILLCILFTGILFAGSRMPLILFFLGLILLFFTKVKIKKVLLVTFVIMFAILQILVSANPTYKTNLINNYSSFYGNVLNIFSITRFIPSFKKDSDDRAKPGIQKWHKTRSFEENGVRKSRTLFYVVVHESHHRRLINTSVDTWKENKIFGNGIKSFREDCWKFKSDPNVNLGMDIYPNKKNRLCSNHPHNYYFEILTETGIVGLLIILIIAVRFAVFAFRKFRLLTHTNFESFILLSAIISLILETFPVKSTGSLFSTNNATYIVLVAAIIISQKTVGKITKNK